MCSIVTLAHVDYKEGNPAGYHSEGVAPAQYVKCLTPMYLLPMKCHKIT